MDLFFWIIYKSKVDRNSPAPILYASIDLAFLQFLSVLVSVVSIDLLVDGVVDLKEIYDQLNVFSYLFLMFLSFVSLDIFNYYYYSRVGKVEILNKRYSAKFSKIRPWMMYAFILSFFGLVVIIN